MFNRNITVTVASLLGVLLLGPSLAQADAFQPPTCGGGWIYTYTGDAATFGTAYAFNSLDGTWDYANGSNSWDGTGPGAPAPHAPGGAAVVTQGDTTFLRMQDTGNPTLYGFVDPSNRKFLFGHSLSHEMDRQTASTILDNGVTLSFRARLSTLAAGGPLDQTCLGGTPVAPRADWPAGGDGYLGANFVIRQESADQAIQFSLALATDMGDGGADVMGGKQGLVMNRLNGSSPSNKVYPATPTHGAMNLLEVPGLDALTAWHEFWITIEKGGAGTHHVTVWMDGNLSPAGSFDVTANTDNDFVDMSYIAMGLPMTGESGALDVDFFKYRPGAVPPAAGPCYTSVAPNMAQSLTTVQSFPTANVVYTITNCGSPDTVTYAVTEMDENQIETDVPWLALSRTSGTLTAGQSEQISVILDSTTDQGPHKAFLKFTDSCSPSNVAIREINLNVLRWGVDGTGALRGYLMEHPSMPIADVTYRINNAPTGPMTYTVTKSDPTAMWLTLSSTAGTVNAGDHQDVVVSFDKGVIAGLAANVYKCTLTFASDASTDTIAHVVRLRVQAAGTTPIWTYTGTVDPEATDSAGPGLRFGMVAGSDLIGAAEYDPAAQNHYAFHMTDTADTTAFYRTQIWNASKVRWDDITVQSELGGTVVARMKVTSHTGNRAGGLYVWDNDVTYASMAAECHLGGSDGVIGEVMRRATATVTGSSDYVVVRMTSKGRRGDFDNDRLVRIYVNENPVPVVELTRAQPFWSSTAGLGFGAGSLTGTADIWFDWVAATNAGAFAPGEDVTVLGKSLVPEFCHIPFADIDRDGDVDQEDFASFQRCMNVGGGAYTDACKCLDRPEPGLPAGNGVIDGNDVLQFVRCSTGPNVPFDLANIPPDCQP